MFSNHILFFILSQCFNLGLLTLEVKEYENTFQNKPENKHIPHYTISEEKLMWKDASIACKKKGMSLAYVNDFTEFIAFKKFLHEIKNNSSGSYSELWIGGYRIKTKFPTNFVWENGKYVQMYGWLHPLLYRRNVKDCLEVRFSNLFGWIDASCDTLNKYICVGEPHEEVMKIDFPEQYQRPNHETHEGGQNINKLKVTTKASTTTSTNSPTYYYGLEPMLESMPEDVLYDFDYND